MVGYKKRIFISVVKKRMDEEHTSSDIILEEYNKLSDEDKNEIIAGIYENLIIVYGKEVENGSDIDSLLENNNELSEKEKEIIKSEILK